MKRPIFTTLGPNYQAQDVWLALRLLFQPWRYTKGKSESRFIELFKQWLGVNNAFAVSSGRDGLFRILSALHIKKDDEVLLQAYTCVVVPDAIVAVGARPVYVDVCRDTFTMNPDDLAKKITPKSRVLIIQHTFGRAADLEKLLSIAKKNNIVVIEDCAHALGVRYNNQMLGTMGDASFFSFGRDKCLSSVFGGMVVLNNPALLGQIQSMFEQEKYPPKWWIMQQLLHPIVVSFAKLTYNIFVGKCIFFLFKKLHLLSKAVSRQEKKGHLAEFVPQKMPNALAALALEQFGRLEKYIEHRIRLVKLYNKALGYELPEVPLLVYPLVVNDPCQLHKRAQQDGLYFGDWYSEPIAPAGVDHAAVGYRVGSCPVAESLAKGSINLPTHINISMKDAQRIIRFLQKDNAYSDTT